jgi:hypothetical protein
MKKVAKRETEQREKLERIHGEIKHVLTDAKKDFQKLNAKDLTDLRESLNLFCMNLRRNLWNPLDKYHSEVAKQKKINELQRYVDQGLRFNFIQFDSETFSLQDTQNGPEVVLRVLNEAELPF